MNTTDSFVDETQLLNANCELILLAAWRSEHRILLRN
jgi:hypothetical protein